MRFLEEILRPRESVFKEANREDVLNLSDLVEERVEPDKFFNENFITKGMELLFETAFARFRGETSTGVIKLTQAMGGGKTHNMLSLALLAKYPEYRQKILDDPSIAKGVPGIKVVAFTGRESDAPFGIWGSIAEQLGKKEYFKDLYSPLRAPGESAWIKLLQGEKVLILLDELPPYLENAKSIEIGNSNLCTVTTTALSNLFSALGKEQLANVCLVLSDLKATYESGSEVLQSSFKELENEANRLALNIEPVGLNSDEVYDILRKRLFYDNETMATDVNEIAIAYKDSIETTAKLNLTSIRSEKLYTDLKDSYPFHPSIKDLYARFKENAGFQQTRGLIRLMRQIVRQFYESGQAKTSYLINVFDIDLNDRAMLSTIKQIKNSVEIAIAHDIAQNGKSTAEEIDQANGFNQVAQTVSKLILMASLSDINHALLGLTESEILGYLSGPNVDIQNAKQALELIRNKAWYLKVDSRGHIYFQNTKNMVAEMCSLIESYSNEQAKKDLRQFLESRFDPKPPKACYQQVYALPALNQVKLDKEKVSLIIFEPHETNKLHPELEAFYENEAYKNRVMFLSGARKRMDRLYEVFKRYTAISQIIRTMDSEHVPHQDQQYKAAIDLQARELQAVCEGIRQTFVILYYPTRNGIVSAEFNLAFKGNHFDGEEQIKLLLEAKRKFEHFSTEDRAIETLRKKCEDRLFTTKEMQMSQIKERAATETSWQWMMPNALDELKKECIRRDLWRENGGYIEKGPFRKESTDVSVEQIDYDDETGEFTYRVKAKYGDKVYYDFGADATTSSLEVNLAEPFKTKELVTSFLCVDSTYNPEVEGIGHPTGDPINVTGEITIRYDYRQSTDGIMLELKTHPKVTLRYTTDGSNPKEHGGIYTDEIRLPEQCKYVLVAAQYGDRVLEEVQIAISQMAVAQQVEIDTEAPIQMYFNRNQRLVDTQSVYEEIKLLKGLNGKIREVTLELSEKEKEAAIEVVITGSEHNISKIESNIDKLREIYFENKDINISLEYRYLLFDKGKHFARWMNRHKIDMNKLQEIGLITQ